MKENNLDIRNRDSSVISLENYINMPPSSSVEEAGDNILHINTKNRPYTLNPSAKSFIDSITTRNEGIKAFHSDSSTLKFAVETAMELNKDGVFIEFGFCTGTTLNFIAALAYNRRVFGFDSLKGLRDNWRSGFDATVFAYKNISRFPFVPLANTTLIIGWIEDTLEKFCEQYLTNEHVAFINIDTDSFESATLIFNGLKNKIIPEQTIIMLDEGYNFSDPQNEGHLEWKRHEFLATNTFASANDLSIKYLAYNQNHQQLVLQFQKNF